MKKIIAIAACLFACTAQAQYSGAEMLQDLRAGGVGYIKAGQYARGILDGMLISTHVSESAPLVCLPEDVKAGRVIEIARRRLEDASAKSLADPAAVLVASAAAREWPCRSSKTGARGGSL